MINHLLRENCNHCLKNIYIGQPSFECSSCKCITHSKCFTHSKSEIINYSYYCVLCKDEIVQQYNPFKYFESNDGDGTLHNTNDDISKISSILDNCQSYTASEFINQHNDNLKNFSSSYFLNIDGNKSNFNSLITELHRLNHNFSVIGLAETNIDSEESMVYSLPKYNSFYQNTQPNKAKGTGVALYVLDTLNTMIDETVSNVTKDIESLFVTTRNNTKVATFGVIYRPPNGNFQCFLNELSTILELLPKKSVYIMGDFNINLLINSKEVKDFEENMFSAGFSPLISTHTHEKPGCRQTCIDNIFTNDIDTLIASGTISDKISHHLPIFHIFDGFSTSNTERNIKHTQYYDYSESNVHHFVSHLEENMAEHPPQSFEEFNNTFKVNLDKACKLSKPRTSKRTPMNNPWITGGIITSITKKHELHDDWSKAKKKKCIYNPSKRCYEITEPCHCHFCTDAREKHAVFIEKRRHVKHIINLARRRYTCGKIKDCDGDSRKIWEVINDIRGKRKKQIKPSFMINNERIICRRIIAHEFNKYFVSIASNLNRAYDERLDIDEDPIIAKSKSFTDYLPQSCPSSIYLAECTSMEITKIINELQNGKASDIPIHVIKHSCHIISDHLAKLYNDCMSNGVFPDQLKTGKITPIYKKENEELLENYRPVSTLPVFGKIFEKIIYSRLYSFLVSRGIIYENQFGFRKGHSTSHALNFSVNHVENNLNKNNHVVGIFIDLSKAFDTLPFDKLLHKLSNYGIRGNTLKLLNSYLNNRHQYVSVLGEESEHLPVTLGVPQGSVLGPLLFLLYINDICRCSNIGTFVLFADDTNVFVSAETKDKAFLIADQILTAISHYMRSNLLHINIKKCCFMHFSPNKRPTIEPECIKLHIDGIPIKQMSKTKFLGVTIDDKLSWVPHIENLVKKLQSICGRIYCIKNYLPKDLYKQIYHTLFESHLVYGISAWGGVSLNRLEPLFLAQKKCIRIIFGDSEAFLDKFRTCARARPIQCEILEKGLSAKDSAKPHLKPCTICILMKKKGEKKVRPHRCQLLGEEFYSRESTKPLFKAHDLMTVQNLYRFHCMMETIKIVRTHRPIAMYSLFQMSERKEDLFITPQHSLNFAYSGANLWNKFFEQSNLRGKLSSMSLGSIKLQLKRSIIQAQNDHDIVTWYDKNFTSFYKLHDV